MTIPDKEKKMMSTYLLFAVLVASVSHMETSGVKMFLTKNGMQYAMDSGIEILKPILMKKVIEGKGNIGLLRWKISGMHVIKAQFNKSRLIPVKNVGMRGILSGISIDAYGMLQYLIGRHYKRVPFILGESDIVVNMTIVIGADDKGHPTIDLKDCDGNIGKIQLIFLSPDWFIYHKLSKFLDKYLKKEFGKLICNTAKEVVDKNVKPLLETFPVQLKLDDVAEIDYTVTESPLYTAEDMVIGLKGEVKSRETMNLRSLPDPSIKPTNDTVKMLYYALSDYSINTAGRTYHEAEKFRTSVNSWEPDVPEELKELLNTTKLEVVASQLKEYGGALMGLDIKTLEPPNVAISNDSLGFNLFLSIDFKLKDIHSGEIKYLFVANFNLTCQAKVGRREESIAAVIEKFESVGNVVKTYIGSVNGSLEEDVIKNILHHAVISKANLTVAGGFPLPIIDKVDFTNSKLSLLQDAILMGTDLKYHKEIPNPVDLEYHRAIPYLMEVP